MSSAGHVCSQDIKHIFHLDWIIIILVKLGPPPRNIIIIIIITYLIRHQRQLVMISTQPYCYDMRMAGCLPSQGDRRESETTLLLWPSKVYYLLSFLPDE